MISTWLLTVLRCPICIQSDQDARLIGEGNLLICPHCRATYPMHADYVDMRPSSGLTGKETVYVDADADLDDPHIRPPVLSAGVRQRVLRLLLRPHRHDSVLDIGCGNGKFAVWNAPFVEHIVGLDPAARFADAARTTVDLVQGDARALPFAPGSFAKAYSVDVFEHLDHDGVRAHLRETRRVIGTGGAYFCFSNTRERSWLNRLIDPGRQIAEALHTRGVVDRTRDHLRKGDHVKAIETTAALEHTFANAGLTITKIWFLNPLFATYLETLGFAIVERTLIKRQRHATGSAALSTTRRMSHVALRETANERKAVRVALGVATAILMGDVIFFRRVRTGPFFLLAKPATRL